MMLLANVGTPLMLASIFWLLLGNLAIGLIEGALLARHIRHRGVKPYGLMIAANYFSAWVGFGLFRLSEAWLDRTVTVANFFPIFAALLLAAWVWSVLLEYPFVWWAFPKRLRRFPWLPLRASLLVQSVSYAGLILWFGSCSSVSLVTDTRLVPATEIAGPTGATVYYASVDGRWLRRIRLDGSHDEPVAPMREEHLHPYGFASLCIRRESGGYVLRQEREGSPALVAAPPGPWSAVYEALARGMQRFEAPVLPGAGGWTAETGFWPIQGVTVKRPGQSSRLAMETPFAMWYPRSATVLSGGRVLFECGQQVLLYDPATKRLALLAKGRVPLVIPDAPPPAGFSF